MRKLKRLKSSAIPKAFKGQDRITKTLDLLKKEREIVLGKPVKHKFPSNWSSCKKELHAESFSKCAYCESPVTVVAYGDVEHYRPKSKYWWLAYCFDNYLASCQLCNQKYKKAKFDILNQPIDPPSVKTSDTDEDLQKLAKKILPDPIIESEGMKWSTFIKQHNTERPLLLNPYIDDPIDYFSWVVDHVKQYVKLRPLDKNNPLHVKMVKAASKDYGINRKELCRHRYDAYLTYATHRLMSEDSQLPNNWKIIAKNRFGKMLLPQGAYSGVIEYFHTLPSNKLSIE